MKYHTEASLIPHALEAMKVHGGSATTAELKEYVLETVELTDGDKEVLPSEHSMMRIERITGNLKSNNTLERLGFAEYVDGVFTITKKGSSFEASNIEGLNLLFSKTMSIQQCIGYVGKQYRNAGIRIDNQRLVAQYVRDNIQPTDNDYECIEQVKALVAAATS